MAVRAGIMDQLGQASFGLFDEACDQRDSAHVVAEPDTAPVGERCDGIVVRSKVSSPVLGRGVVMRSSPNGIRR